MPGLTKSALRTYSNLFFAVLLENLATFYTTGRANKQTGAALSAATLRTAIAQLRMQTDPAGSLLSLEPAVLLVPPALEQIAKELVMSSEVIRDQTADRQPTGNVFQNIARVVVEPRLEAGVTNPYSGTASGGSAARWFLFASPADRPMVAAFLNGNETPKVETFGLMADPNRLAMSFRVFHDCGVALGDYRASQYATA